MGKNWPNLVNLLIIHMDFFQKGRVNYQLGHGSETQSAEEAIQKFLEREFQQLFDESHEAIFIPESFQYLKFAHKVKCVCIIKNCCTYLHLCPFWVHSLKRDLTEGHAYSFICMYLDVMNRGFSLTQGDSNRTRGSIFKRRGGFT
jgi:hypothetical protein